MDLNKIILKAKELYFLHTEEEKREISKLVTGIQRPERIVLNPKSKLRRGK